MFDYEAVAAEDALGHILEAPAEQADLPTLVDPSAASECAAELLPWPRPEPRDA